MITWVYDKVIHYTKKLVRRQIINTCTAICIYSVSTMTGLPLYYIHYFPFIYDGYRLVTLG